MATNLSLMKPTLRGSATISEVSSTSGKGSNAGDTQELQDLVSVLGLNSIEDLYQERIRVDRKKLEVMMQGMLLLSTFRHVRQIIWFLF